MSSDGLTDRFLLAAAQSTIKQCLDSLITESSVKQDMNRENVQLKHSHSVSLSLCIRLHLLSMCTHCLTLESFIKLNGRALDINLTPARERSLVNIRSRPY